MTSIDFIKTYSPIETREYKLKACDFKNKQIKLEIKFDDAQEDNPSYPREANGLVRKIITLTLPIYLEDRYILGSWARDLEIPDEIMLDLEDEIESIK